MAIHLTPLLAPFAVHAAVAPPEWRFHAEAVLGTRLELNVACASPTAALRGAEAALAEISRLERLLSWRDPPSELARLNATSRLAVSAELFEVLARAAHWRTLSAGAFDERLGLATRLWRKGESDSAREAAKAARTSDVRLDPDTRTIHRDAGAHLDLDAIAKGYIVDRALAALRATEPGITAALVSIGGDMAGWRKDDGAWRIGLSKAGEIADNAPLASIVDLGTGAIATSGRGQRDVVVNGRCIGPALSRTGAPAEGRICATARADCAMDADALATIALVLPPEESLRIAAQTPGASLRITGTGGQLFTSPTWQERAPPELLRVQATPALPATAEKFPIDWQLAVWYRMPDRRRHGADFREPYMAVWITDASNKPVRTLFMVGRNPKWQRDNFIWWSNYRAQTNKIIDARSTSTAPTGRYAFMWDGDDDTGKRVPAGKYTIHVETSREPHAHSYRTLPIDISKQAFEKSMPELPLDGGFTAVFGHYNDVHDYAPPDFS